MRNKFLTIIMATVMAVGVLAGCGSKQETNGEENLGSFMARAENGVIDLHQVGVKINIPDELKDKQDKIGGSCYVDRNMGTIKLFMVDENDSENTDYEIAECAGYREDISVEEIMGDETSLSADVIRDLGTNKTYFYKGFRFDKVYEENPAMIEELAQGLDDEKKAEYLDLISYSTQLLDNIELVPVTIPEMPKPTALDSAKIMGYVLKDIDGKEIALGDLISANKVTMINYWGVECGPCVGEMPGLEELSQKYKDQGFGIVGLTTDIIAPDGSFDEDAIDNAKSIRQDTGVTYPLLICDAGVLNDSKLQGTPTTYFVDSNGNILESVLGSRSEDTWDEMIAKKLQEVQ